jgi:hypothetical protein
MTRKVTWLISRAARMFILTTHERALTCQRDAATGWREQSDVDIVEWLSGLNLGLQSCIETDNGPCAS